MPTPTRVTEAPRPHPSVFPQPTSTRSRTCCSPVIPPTPCSSTRRPCGRPTAPWSAAPARSERGGEGAGWGPHGKASVPASSVEGHRPRPRAWQPGGDRASIMSMLTDRRDGPEARADSGKEGQLSLRHLSTQRTRRLEDVSGVAGAPDTSARAPTGRPGSGPGRPGGLAQSSVLLTPTPTSGHRPPPGCSILTWRRWPPLGCPLASMPLPRGFQDVPEIQGTSKLPSSGTPGTLASDTASPSFAGRQSL